VSRAFLANSQRLSSALNRSTELKNELTTAMALDPIGLHQVSDILCVVCRSWESEALTLFVKLQYDAPLRRLSR
jgi:hypothetical protein